jgi:uroporphyrinogen-III synthase
VAAVGRETARVLEEGGASVALVPEEERQDGLAAALADAIDGLAPGTRVLFPQAVGGREELRNALLARGCIVDVVPASQIVALRGLTALQATTVAVIGPTTAAAATALGLSPLVAGAPSADALIRAIAAAKAVRS